MTQPAPLRVVYVEDDENGVRHVIAELSRRIGIDVDHVFVRDAEDLKRALQSGEWDLVVSGFAMAGMGAADALALTRAVQPDLPFVVVSGALGKEDAVEMMRRGADGCLLWDRLDRIGSVVARVLQERRDRVRYLDAEQSLRSVRERFGSAFAAAPIGMALVDVSGGFIRANPALCRMLGRDARDLEGARWQDVVQRSETARVREVLDTIRSAGVDLFEGVMRYQHTSGDTVWTETSATALREPGEDAALYIHVQDVTARKLAEAQLDHRSTHDPLTDLPSRTLFLEHLTKALARLDRKHTQLAVLFLDLDRFKVVNDTFGHLAGDEILLAAARRIREKLRPADIASRLGGDEYVVLVEDLENRSDATDLAERLLSALALPYKAGPKEIHLTVSAGIAFAPGKDIEPDALVHRADVAMHRAKQHGRARVHVLDEASFAQTRQRRELEIALGRGIESGEFVLHYQPIVDVGSGRLMATEALLRWRRPQRGLTVAGSFIDVLEESGLLARLSPWILDTACRQCAEWRESGSVDETFTMFVNLAPSQLSDADLVDHVRSVLALNRLPPPRLCLEITETHINADPETSRQMLDELCSLGVQLAIDDFGTGYSTLSRLIRFPIDVLKIDGAFVRGLGRNPDDTAVVTAILGLARNLGRVAVAEGVESGDQLAQLSALGCEYAQGFHIARPMPAERLPAAAARRLMEER